MDAVCCCWKGSAVPSSGVCTVMSSLNQENYTLLHGTTTSFLECFTMYMICTLCDILVPCTPSGRCPYDVYISSSYLNGKNVYTLVLQGSLLNNI